MKPLSKKAIQYLGVYSFENQIVDLKEALDDLIRTSKHYGNKPDWERGAYHLDIGIRELEKAAKYLSRYWT